MSPAPGRLRPHWQKFTETLDRLGASGLAECSGQARRAMADNGVTYNVYGDPQGMDGGAVERARSCAEALRRRPAARDERRGHPRRERQCEAVGWQILTPKLD